MVVAASCDPMSAVRLEFRSLRSNASGWTRTGRRTEFCQVPNTIRRAWPGSRPANRAYEGRHDGRIDFVGGDGADNGIECLHRLHRDTAHVDRRTLAKHT